MPNNDITVNEFNKLLLDSVNNPLGIPDDQKGEIIKITMDDLYKILDAFGKDQGNEPYKDLKNINNTDPLYHDKNEIIRLHEYFLNYRFWDGKHEFCTANDGQFVIGILKKYKPLPQKPDYNFVVEM